MGEAALDEDGDPTLLDGSATYFRQPRFASGQLFVGSNVTCLIVNTYFNPSLLELIQEMTAADVVIENVPPELVGSNYQSLFEHMLRYHSVLPVGLYRITAGRGGSRR